MSAVRRGPTDPVAVPDHLLIEPAPASRKGNLRCRECRHRVTIGDDGTEFGHVRRGKPSSDGFTGRCPHRPESVDPTFDGPTPWSAGVRDGDRSEP